MRTQSRPAAAASSCDADLVRRALARDGSAFRAIMEQHNRRLYRIARSILGSDSDAEDALQEAYFKAFTHLDRFRGDASLTTWLSRITMNEALERLRRERLPGRAKQGSRPVEAQILPFPNMPQSVDPEQTMAQLQVLRLAEKAADSLPDIFRIVFVARVMEGMSVEETADLLRLHPKTVKTRLHRARRLLRKHLEKQIGPVLLDAFPFAGKRCQRLTAAVLRQLQLSP